MSRKNTSSVDTTKGDRQDSDNSQNESVANVERYPKSAVTRFNKPVSGKVVPGEQDAVDGPGRESEPAGGGRKTRHRGKSRKNKKTRKNKKQKKTTKTTKK